MHGHQQESRRHQQFPEPLPTRLGMHHQTTQFGPGHLLSFEAEEVPVVLDIQLLAVERVLDDA